MGNKTFWWALAAVGTITAVGANDGTVYMDRYPSSADIQRMQRRGVTSLVISPEERIGSPATLNFPDAPKVDRLNDLDRASIAIHVRTSSFPMAAPLNRAKSHIRISGVIDNCLSSSAEKARLTKIRRPVEIAVLCRTDGQTERAERLAREVMAESPVSVSVRQVRD